jgi:hypothetical protein
MRLSRKEIRQDKNVRLPYSVAVRSASEAPQGRGNTLSVSNAVEDLLATGLFLDVYKWSSDKNSDLIAEVQNVSGITRCGTPFLLYAMSLGLVSAESDYRQWYNFTLTSPSTGKSMSFKKTYSGAMYMPSVVLIPFAYYRKSPNRVDLLRHDLTSMTNEIQALVNNRSRTPIAKPIPSGR